MDKTGHFSSVHVKQDQEIVSDATGLRSRPKGNVDGETFKHSSRSKWCTASGKNIEKAIKAQCRILSVFKLLKL